MNGQKYHSQYLLDEDGEPYPSDDMKAASDLIHDRSKRCVAESSTQVHGQQILVSTVFLVINHQAGEGPPLLYQTQVFLDGVWIEETMRRYETREEALRGHTEVVEVVKSAMNALDILGGDMRMLDALLRYLEGAS